MNAGLLTYHTPSTFVKLVKAGWRSWLAHRSNKAGVVGSIPTLAKFLWVLRFHSQLIPYTHIHISIYYYISIITQSSFWQTSG